MSQPSTRGHQTISTVYSSSPAATSIWWDPSYLHSLPGVLKLVQIIFSFVGFICIELSGLASHTRGGFFNFIALVAVCFTGILLLFYLLHVIEKTSRIPWLMVEFAFNAIWTLGFLAVSIMAATYGSDSYLAAAFFGFCCMLAYGFDAFLKYSALNRGEVAQGERYVQKQISTTQIY